MEDEVKQEPDVSVNNYYEADEGSQVLVGVGLVVLLLTNLIWGVFTYNALENANNKQQTQVQFVSQTHLIVCDAKGNCCYRY